MLSKQFFDEHKYVFLASVLFILIFSLYNDTLGDERGPSQFDYYFKTPIPVNVNIIRTAVTEYGQVEIKKEIISGTPQLVSNSLSAVPNGVSYNISNQPCAPRCASFVTFTVEPWTPAGTFPITVTGTPLNKTTSFNLNIISSSGSGSPVRIFCQTSVNKKRLGQEVTWTANVVDGTPPYSYQWSGTNIPDDPPSAPTSSPTNSYYMTYSTIGTKIASAIVTDATSNSAICEPVLVRIFFTPSFRLF
jgi:hypothetical protein